MQNQICRQAVMLTATGATVLYNGFFYSLEEAPGFTPAISCAYYGEKVWDSVKSKRLAKAAEQLGIEGLCFVEIEPREVSFI